MGKADEYADKLLDEEPELIEAYLIKLLSECELDEEEGLGELDGDISVSPNYQMLMRYGDEALKTRLHQYYIMSALEYFRDIVETSEDVEELEYAYDAISEDSELDESGELLEKCTRKLEVLRNKEDKLSYIRTEIDQLNEKLLISENDSLVHQVLHNIKQYYMENFADTDFKPILMELTTTKNLLAYASDSPFAVCSGDYKETGVYKEKHQFFLFFADKNSPNVKVCVYSSSDQEMENSPLDEKNVYIDFSKRSMPILRFKPVTLNVKVTVDYI